MSNIIKRSCVPCSKEEYAEIQELFNELMKKHNGDRDAVVKDAASHPLIVKFVDQIDRAVTRCKDDAIHEFLMRSYEKD